MVKRREGELIYIQRDCDDLEPCPWCGDKPVLCSDGVGGSWNHWVECRNRSLSSESRKTCPVCPVARADKETLSSGVSWMREKAIEKWNSWM